MKLHYWIGTLNLSAKKERTYLHQISTYHLIRYAELNVFS